MRDDSTNQWWRKKKEGERGATAAHLHPSNHRHFCVGLGRHVQGVQVNNRAQFALEQETLTFTCKQTRAPHPTSAPPPNKETSELNSHMASPDGRQLGPGPRTCHPCCATPAPRALPESFLTIQGYKRLLCPFFANYSPSFVVFLWIGFVRRFSPSIAISVNKSIFLPFCVLLPSPFLFVLCPFSAIGTSGHWENSLLAPSCTTPLK